MTSRDDVPTGDARRPDECHHCQVCEAPPRMEWVHDYERGPTVPCEATRPADTHPHDDGSHCGQWCMLHDRCQDDPAHDYQYPECERHVVEPGVRIKALVGLVHALMGHVGYVGELRVIYDEHQGDRITSRVSASADEEAR